MQQVKIGACISHELRCILSLADKLFCAPLITPLVTTQWSHLWSQPSGHNPVVTPLIPPPPPHTHRLPSKQAAATLHTVRTSTLQHLDQLLRGAEAATSALEGRGVLLLQPWA